MTSKAVAQAGYLLQNVTNGNQAAKMPKDSHNSFGNIMNSTVKQSENKVSSDNKPEKTAQTNQKETSVADTKAKTETQKSDPKKTEGDMSEVIEKVEQAVEDITKKIADEFGMTEEELAKVMEMLGMQAADLFQPNMLANLIAELSGESDMLAVITNEELYTTLTDINEIVSNVSEELLNEYDISPEDLKKLLEEMQSKQEAKMSDAGVKENSQADMTVPETIPDEKTSEDLPKTELPKVENLKAENANDGADLENVIQTEENPQKNNDMMQENGKGTKQFGEQEQMSKVQNVQANQSKEAAVDTPKETVVNPMQTFTEQITAKLDAVLQKATMPMEAADTERIMKQVTEYLKLNIRPEVTEMQMKLNPASLGTIDLSVAYKDGALTAQFTAQNEAVKSALETQVIQLRENLSEQGVKVEAIEVTIASHEFERNLSQSNTDEEQNSQHAKSGKRKINLDAVDGFEEIPLDEAERIAVELMKENGNTVDFSA